MTACRETFIRRKRGVRRHQLDLSGTDIERIGSDFQQKVAVKVMRRGLFSELEQRLFLRERRVLAALTFVDEDVEPPPLVYGWSDAG